MGYALQQWLEGKWIAWKGFLAGNAWHKDEPRQYSIVKLTDDWMEDYEVGIFHRDDFQFIYMGEIPNMGGHCIVMGWSTGKVYAGFHTERFREATEDEV